MTRFLMCIGSTAWCGFYAYMLIDSAKYATTPVYTIFGLAFIFVGWLAMLNIAKDC